VPYLIIGSHAARNAGMFVEEPNDIDLIADYDTALLYLRENGYRQIIPMNGGKSLVGSRRGVPKEVRMCEISLAWPGTTNELILQRMQGQAYASLDLLYMLKMSHRYLKDSPHFYKTMRHIKRMRNLSAMIGPEWQQIYELRMKETYDYKMPNLNQNKKGFFSGDGVEYKYDHDTIHEAVAIMEKTPMYKRYQKDGSQVAVDRAKWEELPLAYKQMAVAEESAVLALERSLVPFPGAKSPFDAFKLALMKVCTSITGGWFREFAWENHDEVLAMVLRNEYDFLGLFEQGLKNGIVKEFQ
jgi:hypothetical protein